MFHAKYPATATWMTMVPGTKSRITAPSGIPPMSTSDGLRTVMATGAITVRTPSDVDIGGAPYSYGYWSYIGPWGWTWVGYEPWGFAPYHYGRWAFIGSRWGWCPGPYYARPIYGPAFVGFLGGGFSVGFGFGGGIGWFPLGPHEPFRPWYHTSAIYFRNVNFNNTRSEEHT